MDDYATAMTTPDECEVCGYTGGKGQVLGHMAGKSQHDPEHKRAYDQREKPTLFDEN